MDEKGNSKGSETVEEVVVKASVLTVDTTDKKSQQYKQANTYAAKKTVAQGMMDVALITANANQLRYLIEYQRSSPTFFVILSLIIVSLMLQVSLLTFAPRHCKQCLLPSTLITRVLVAVDFRH